MKQTPVLLGFQLYQKIRLIMVRVVIRGMKKLSNNEASSQSQCLQKELSDRFLQSLMNSISQ